MLLADVTRDYSRSILTRTDALTEAALHEQFELLVERAREDLQREGFTGERTVIERLLDVRYVGQSYEITLPFTPGYRDQFDARHARLYGYANPRRPTEVVNLRLKATGITSKPVLPRASESESHRALPYAVSTAWFGGQSHVTALYRWEQLGPGATGPGPAVIAGGQATTVVPPGFMFRIDQFGNVVAVRAPVRPKERSREAVERAG
jgi:N-methylhydantoinase A/oxoprolinase/acetone carboxylase beta subunit